MMMVVDTIDNAWAWFLFFASLCGCVILLVVLGFFFRLAVVYAIRSIRRRFVEGRI